MACVTLSVGHVARNLMGENVWLRSYEKKYDCVTIEHAVRNLTPV